MVETQEMLQSVSVCMCITSDSFVEKGNGM